jgi:hypothetical protein
MTDQPYHNEATQAERREMLKGDTYHSRAQNELGQELGRWAHLSKGQRVTGTAPSVWPTMPANNPWASNVVPDEPPTGQRIDEMEPIGGPPEPAAASVAECSVSPRHTTEPTFKRRL